MSARLKLVSLTSINILAAAAFGTIVVCLAAPAAAASGGNETGIPPDEWVYTPTELDADFRKFECTFPFATNVIPHYHPSAACQEKQWGKSGIFREQGRDLHVTTVLECNGDMGDLDVIRLCNKDWENQDTHWGPAGPGGCVRIRTVFTCGM